MNGLMMDVPLTVPSILHRAARFFADREIATRLHDGSMRRTTYGQLARRVAQLQSALLKLGVRPGDRVASFAWNSDRHLELYFAVPAIGAVLHTINVRLAKEQLAFLINHAEDCLIFTDGSLAGPLEEIRDEIPTVRHIIVMEDRDDSAQSDSSWLDYETLIDEAEEDRTVHPISEEMAAGLCYTSGTTGQLKGALYSHRAQYLHAMGICMTDSIGVSERDTILPVVPMFHVNAWGLPYAAAMVGAKLLFAGPTVIGRSLAELMETERVTLTAGVPTVWTMLDQHLRHHPHDLSSVSRIYVGGAATPASLIEKFERDHGLPVIPAWGMTETTPVGLVGRLPSAMPSNIPLDRRQKVRVRPGPPVVGMDVRIVDDSGTDLPWDGRTAGELWVRGPWVARQYYNNTEPEAARAFTADGWFRTGDIATIDEFGYVQITDRLKDLVKCKGEWISSVDMENFLTALPGVAEAAVVAKPDPKRDEVPVIFIVRRDSSEPAVQIHDLLTHLETRFARWQLPRTHDVHFVDTIPKTTVGKIDKKVLRKQVAEAASTTTPAKG